MAGLPRRMAVLPRYLDSLRSLPRVSSMMMCGRPKARASSLVFASKLLVAADHPVGVRDEGLVAVPAVHVDEDVGPLDDFLVEDGGDPLARRARRVAGEDAVEVLPVVGAVVDRPLLEARQVGDVDHEHGPAQGLGVDEVLQPVEGEDGRIFVGVDARDEGQDGPLLRPVDDRVRDLGRGAVPGRDGEG